MTNQKYLDLTEFVEGGYLHEVNRQVLHPAGLALEVTLEPGTGYKINGVWDERDAPGGIILAEVDQTKIDKVAAEQADRSDWRQSRFGFFIQTEDTAPNAYDEAMSGHYDERGNRLANEVPATKSTRKPRIRKTTTPKKKVEDA